METYTIPINTGGYVDLRVAGVELDAKELSILEHAVATQSDHKGMNRRGQVIAVYVFKRLLRPARYTICVAGIPVAVAREVWSKAEHFGQAVSVGFIAAVITALTTMIISWFFERVIPLMMLSF